MRKPSAYLINTTTGDLAIIALYIAPSKKDALQAPRRTSMARSLSRLIFPYSS